jgi:hypothetical protein
MRASAVTPWSAFEGRARYPAPPAPAVDQIFGASCCVSQCKSRVHTATGGSGAPDRIGDWFTEEFRLHEPGKPALPVGHEGARQMMEAGRQNRMRAGVQATAKVEILDMIQEGDRVPCAGR